MSYIYDAFSKPSSIFAQSTSQAQSGSRLAAGLRIGGRELGSGGPSVQGQAAPDQVRKAEEKNSIYDNFSREIAKRLERSGPGQSEDSAQALVQSLTGAMGEIEKLFGREAATMVMARILTGTAGGADESNLISSLSNGLAGLQRSDPTGAKLKQLTQGFNQDLALSLDPEAIDRKLNDGSTLSLSYALARHFGDLSAVKLSEGKKVTPEEKPEKAGQASQANNLSEALASPALELPAASSPAAPTQPGDRNFNAEIYEMFGFDETGRWDTVEVTKLDQQAAEEVKEMAEYGLVKVREVTLSKLIKADSGEGKFLDNLAIFLADKLDDEESAEFVKKAIFEAREFVEKNWGADPKLAEVLSQVYSKIAAEGEAEKLAAFENYINNDFKEALNPVLAEYTRIGEDIPPDLADLVGELQFKGLGGASKAGENDVFSLTWGYKDNSVYDRTTTKRFLQEDFQAVKAVKEKKDEFEQKEWAKEWDEALHDNRLLTRRKPADDSTEPNAETQATLMEKFNAERRQNKLAELLDAKFGQLSDESMGKLAQYIKDRYSEDEAESLLENIKWNKNLMSGLAALHRDMQALGANDGDSRAFVNFLNDNLKQDVENVARKMGGPGFEGWQAPEEAGGDLKASFTFAGQEPVRVSLKTPEPPEFIQGDSELSIAQQNLSEALAISPYGRRWPGSGGLINQMA